MGMSRKAVGYYNRPQTYVDKASNRIKGKLCQQAQLARKVLFPDKKSLLDLYFKMILPSVTYGITLWRICNNCDPH